jgi:hypothetical protein
MSVYDSFSTVVTKTIVLKLKKTSLTPLNADSLPERAGCVSISTVANIARFIAW